MNLQKKTKQKKSLKKKVQFDEKKVKKSKFNMNQSDLFKFPKRNKEESKKDDLDKTKWAVLSPKSYHKSKQSGDFSSKIISI